MRKIAVGVAWWAVPVIAGDLGNEGIDEPKDSDKVDGFPAGMSFNDSHTSYRCVLL